MYVSVGFSYSKEENLCAKQAPHALSVKKYFYENHQAVLSSEESKINLFLQYEPFYNFSLSFTLTW